MVSIDNELKYEKSNFDSNRILSQIDSKTDIYAKVDVFFRMLSLDKFLIQCYVFLL